MTEKNGDGLGEKAESDCGKELGGSSPHEEAGSPGTGGVVGGK